MLKKKIEEKFIQAFKQEFPQLDLAAHPIEITRSTHPRFAHYQCNSKMKLSKVLQMSPREIANKVVATLNSQGEETLFEHLEVAGPGFINLTLRPTWLSQQCQKMASYAYQVTQKQKIIID